MLIDLEYKLSQVRDALPSEMKQRASFVIFQMSQMQGEQLRWPDSFMPLRQLVSECSNLDEQQCAVFAFYILGEANLLDSGEEKSTAKASALSDLKAAAACLRDTIEAANDEEHDAQTSFFDFLQTTFEVPSWPWRR